MGLHALLLLLFCLNVMSHLTRLTHLLKLIRVTHAFHANCPNTSDYLQCYCTRFKCSVIVIVCLECFVCPLISFSALPDFKQSWRIAVFDIMAIPYYDGYLQYVMHLYFKCKQWYSNDRFSVSEQTTIVLHYSQFDTALGLNLIPWNVFTLLENV